MGDTNSSRVVAALIAADASVKTKGFARSVRDLSQGEDEGYEDEEDLYALARRIVPDAFKIDEERVTIYEVVDSHPIRVAKASAIAELNDEIHEYLDREFWVVTLDYTGHVTSELPGWCYYSVYTADYVVPGCLDITPAARAVYRNRKGVDDMTLEEMRTGFPWLFRGAPIERGVS